MSGSLRRGLIVLLTALLLGAFILPLNSTMATTDYLLIHNNDYIVLGKANSDDITFHFYSISGRSRIDIDKGAGVIEERIIFRDSDGWQSRSYSSDMVKIIIKETGTNKGTTDLPGDSDVVIRINSGEAKVINKYHEDSSKKGMKCSVCGKVLTW